MIVLEMKCPQLSKPEATQIDSENATNQIVLPASYSCGFRLFLMSIPTPILNLPVHTYPCPKLTIKTRQIYYW